MIMNLPRDHRKFCLKWDEFECQLKLVFQQLYETKKLSDVTLQCDHNGSLDEIQAHKVVLSMYSPFLATILSESPESHPVITLEGVSAYDLRHVLEFVYLGKVSVYQENIQGFMDTAHFLRIEGIDLCPKSSVAGVLKQYEPEDKNVPLNLSKSSPTHPFEYSSPKPSERTPLKIEAGNTLLLHPAQNAQISGHNLEEPTWSSLRSPCVGYQTVPAPNTQLSPNCNGFYGGTLHSSVKTPGQASKAAPIRTSAFSPYPKQNLERNSKETSPVKDETKMREGSSPSSSNAPSPDSNVELFTTPSGMVVSTAYGLKQPSQVPTSDSSNSSPLTLMSNMMKMSAVNPILPDSTETKPPVTSKRTSQKIVCQSKMNPQKSIKYTPSQVRAIVQSVDGVVGPFVPCKICQKVVKRERLRTHIYECHLINGEKIHCPYCNVALKSKGSYRVHVWRHRNGNLKKSSKIRPIDKPNY